MAVWGSGEDITQAYPTAGRECEAARRGHERQELRLVLVADLGPPSEMARDIAPTLV
ncbi:hypothetical protein WKI71_44080 [Streptomyces sp. MS1.AVA.1]|uniref:Uncharacterized protein n=1 Tax=Streptomyces machairae TaxID=3134109 RepID=A0ABU8UV99_9ACTN